jgi:hypothetical protein
MRTFRGLLICGVAAVVLLAVLGLYPIAFVVAAATVPLMMVAYVVDVDLYESEPVSVVSATMAWGVLAGIATGVAARTLFPSGLDLITASTGEKVLSRGVLLPILIFVIALMGPLFLLRNRRFNDALDGATFGGATGVTFAAAFAVAQGSSLFSSGVRPVGATLPWIYHLLGLAVALPVLLGATLGAACGSLWLRYRAPVTDRALHHVLSRPALGLVAAAFLNVLAGCAQTLFSPLLALVCLAVLDVVALIWLRQVIHLGLVEEASEISIDPPAPCPNCGEMTPRHTFCSSCGVALRALPKARPPRAEPPAVRKVSS